MGEREQKVGLEDLAEELTRREWVAHVRRRSKRLILEVTNPEVGSAGERPLTDVVTCQDAPGGSGLAYSLPGGQTIGFVTDVHAAADQIQHVLRSVGR